MKYFIKKNHSSHTDTLLKEANALAILTQATETNPYLRIPKIIQVDENELILEQIKSRHPTQALFQQLGKGLAHLHQHRYPQYGFAEDNYIGLNPQKNCLSDNWGAFFIEYRLLPQIEWIRDNAIKDRFRKTLLDNAKKLEQFLNEYCTYPSLVHGDLWSGNALYDQDNVWLIDPALYYGDREVDIAMSEMFGGFDKAFYDAYNGEFPLSPVYEQKRVIYNLYHYLNHYNLFGAGYLGACREGFNFLSSL